MSVFLFFIDSMQRLQVYREQFNLSSLYTNTWLSLLAELSRTRN